MKLIARIVAIVASFVLLFAAYGGRVDPNIWTLPALATLALPAVALVALVILLLLAAFRQWRSAVVLLGAFLLAWPTLRLITPFIFFHSSPDKDKHQLTVMTMNVEQFNWQDGDSKPSKTMRYILDTDADIVVIQEGLVYFPFEKQAKLKPMLAELYEKYPYRKKHFYDVGILSKYPFTEVESPVLAQDTLNYFIKAWDVDAPGGNLRVVSMHLSSLRMNQNDNRIIESMGKPSGRKQRAKSVLKKLTGGFRGHVRQSQAVRQLLDDSGTDVLVMGDMNETPGSFAYRTICGDDLRDAWADAGFGPTYTFHTNHLYVKIDHILYRGDMKVLSCRRDKKGESDHYPMVAVFQR